ncbi:MAG: hypothetical protein IIA67_02545, partial [Planctomycetes bacterium]|nr:hypothetical protein [Planctomycetota bacterium]
MPKKPNPATSTRRTFIKAASVAALAAPVAPTILAAADKSGSKKPIVGEGAFKYEVTHNFGELPDHVQWGETHGVCVDREGLIYVKHRSHAATPVDAIVVFDAKGKYVRSFGKRFHHGGHGIDVRLEGKEEFLYLSDVTNRVTEKTNLKGETVWRKTYPKEPGVYKSARQYSPTNICFSPDGSVLASCSEDESIRTWNVRSGKQQLLIEGHSYPIQAVAFSPNGKWLASAAGDLDRVTKPGEVKLWDAATGKESKTFPEHTRAATGVVFSPDGTILISTSEDETVNVYDVQTGKALGFFGGHSRPTTSAVFCLDGNTIISGSGGRAKGKNEVKIWDRKTGEEWATIEDHEGKVTAVALAPDGKTLATASYDKSVGIWDLGPVLAKLGKTAAEPAVAPKPEKA